MKVTSNGFVNGIIHPKYGQEGTHFYENIFPTYSLPLKVEDTPKETVSLALVLED